MMIISFKLLLLKLRNGHKSYVGIIIKRKATRKYPKSETQVVIPDLLQGNGLKQPVRTCKNTVTT